jgi:hypothetical protein
MNENADASSYCLDHVSNSDLHQSIRRLVGRSNQVFAALLAHLAEVDARGIHRQRSCTSLYTYCIYELRMSEDAAFRRARAAKIARQFPILFEQIAAGEIHLSGVLMLGPVLTDANHREVLALAKHRTKRELARLVRMISPLADARCVVEPLGPVKSRRLIDQSGDIRELSPGDRPRDWMQTDSADPFAELATGDGDASALASTSGEVARSGAIASSGAIGSGGAIASSGAIGSGGAIASSGRTTTETCGAGDAAPSPLLVPQRYMIQFTAPQEYIDLLQKAKDLSAFGTGSLVEIHLDAMRSFVAELEKRRCGAQSKRLTQPRAEPPALGTAAPPALAIAAPPSVGKDAVQHDGNRTNPSTDADPTAGTQTPCSDDGAVSEMVDPRLRLASADLPREREESGVLPRQRGVRSEPLEREDAVEPPPEQRDDGDGAHSTRRRGRHVPRDVRRHVWQRDEGRCKYVDERGVRCHETTCLELDHELPHARGGPPTARNLRLRCRAHNQLTAENDFGREFMNRKKGNGKRNGAA